jgi:hypothetical protein
MCIAIEADIKRLSSKGNLSKQDKEELSRLRAELMDVNKAKQECSSSSPSPLPFLSLTPSSLSQTSKPTPNTANSSFPIDRDRTSKEELEEEEGSKNRLVFTTERGS